MQSTGQTSTQAVSFVSIQGSVMMNGMLASLRNMRNGVCPAIQFRQPGPDRSAFRTRTGELYRETSRRQPSPARGPADGREARNYYRTSVFPRARNIIGVGVI